MKTNNTPQTIDPLMSLKAVQDGYKLNLSTIRSIVKDDTMPVVWLGKKRYLRQSDLETYITKHTTTSNEEEVQEDELQEPTKPANKKARESIAPKVKEPQKLSREAILRPPSKPNRTDKLQAEILRRENKRTLSVA